MLVATYHCSPPGNCCSWQELQSKWGLNLTKHTSAKLFYLFKLNHKKYARGKKEDMMERVGRRMMILLRYILTNSMILCVYIYLSCCLDCYLLNRGWQWNKVGLWDVEPVALAVESISLLYFLWRRISY